MTAAHRRYFAVEMGIAAIINAVLSVAFMFLVFGRQTIVPVWGLGGIVFDAAPQSFMVAMMSCLVPTLLTRRRIAAGTVPPMAAGFALPQRAIARAVLVAAATAVVAVAIQAIVLPRFGPSWSFQHVLAFKAVYGACLGAAVAALSIRLALGEKRA